VVGLHLIIVSFYRELVLFCDELIRGWGEWLHACNYRLPASIFESLFVFISFIALGIAEEMFARR